MTDLMAIKEAVESRTGVIFTLYAWQQTPKDRDEWGTITMDGQADAVWGDGHMEEQGLEGSVHLFTRSVTSGAPGAVQQALNAFAEMLSLMNSCRAESGLGDLSFLPSLAEAASIRAREASVCWSHTRPDGSAWYTAGAGTACGENLAKGFRTAAEACAAWMSSPSHAANILFPGFRYVSIGSYISPAGTRYWSVEFA